MDSGKPLAGAAVNLSNVHAGKTFKIKTDDFGRFVIPDTISVDPSKAETYYFKGSLLLYATQPALTGKVTVPPAGAAEALKKYLELAPDGEHAEEVRAMLNYLAALAKAAAAGNSKKN